MSKTFNTPEEVAAVLPKDIAEKYLAHYDHEYASGSDVFPTHELAYTIKWSFDWSQTPEGYSYWEDVFYRARAGEFDKPVEEVPFCQLAICQISGCIKKCNNTDHNPPRSRAEQLEAENVQLREIIKVAVDWYMYLPYAGRGALETYNVMRTIADAQKGQGK
jgi:hypothetical protein